jgi:hypothetical protein
MELEVEVDDGKYRLIWFFSPLPALDDSGIARKYQGSMFVRQLYS